MDSRGAAAPRSLRRFTVEDGRSRRSGVVDGTEVGVLTSVCGTAGARVREARRRSRGRRDHTQLSAPVDRS
jgi:hypothetical protein